MHRLKLSLLFHTFKDVFPASARECGHTALSLSNPHRFLLSNPAGVGGAHLLDGTAARAHNVEGCEECGREERCPVQVRGLGISHFTFLATLFSDI